MNYRIRKEAERDHSQVKKLLIAAFEQNEESLLVERLRQSPGFVPALSLVAEQEGQIVGHILFTIIHIRCPKERVPTLSLAPVSVLPDFQKQGIGAALIRAGLEKARELGYSSVILLGHPDYYPRFGFRPAGHWGITTTMEVPDEAFMALELTPGALEDCAGQVEYSAPFGIP